MADNTERQVVIDHLALATQLAEKIGDDIQGVDLDNATQLLMVEALREQNLRLASLTQVLERLVNIAYDLTRRP